MPEQAPQQTTLSPQAQINNRFWAAVCSSDISGIQMALAEGADINSRKNGVSALLLASFKGDVNVVNALLHPPLNPMAVNPETVDINARDPNDCTPLIIASMQGHGEVIQCLLNANPNLNLQNKLGKSALIYLAARGDASLVRKLLQKKPNLDIQDEHGQSALMHAALSEIDPAIQEQNFLSIVHQLLSASSKVTTTIDKKGRNALMYAALGGDVNIFNKLLKYKFDINAQDEDKMTLLMFAVKGGGNDIVDKLLNEVSALSSHINLENKENQTAFDLAVKEKNIAAIESFVSLCSLTAKSECIDHFSQNTVVKLMDAVRRNAVARVVPYFSQKDSYGREIVNNHQKNVALLIAVKKGYLDVAKWLLRQQGVDINTKDIHGNSPLMIAASNIHINIVEFLLAQQNVDINASRSEDNMTAYLLAGKEHWTRDCDTIKKLLFTSHQLHSIRKSIETMERYIENKSKKLQENPPGLQFQNKSVNVFILDLLKSTGEKVKKLNQAITAFEAGNRNAIVDITAIDKKSMQEKVDYFSCINKGLRKRLNIIHGVIKKPKQQIDNVQQENIMFELTLSKIDSYMQKCQDQNVYLYLEKTKELIGKIDEQLKQYRDNNSQKKHSLFFILNGSEQYQQQYQKNQQEYNIIRRLIKVNLVEIETLLNPVHRFFEQQKMADRLQYFPSSDTPNQHFSNNLLEYPINDSHIFAITHVNDELAKTQEFLQQCIHENQPQVSPLSSSSSSSLFIVSNDDSDDEMQPYELPSKRRRIDNAEENTTATLQH